MARIALDIDSTLHHYWDLLERIAEERFGVALPYAEQRDWGTALERDAMIRVIEETHSDANIEAGVPYPGAVETVRRWHDEDGHWIHVTSHRRDSAEAATARWLEAIGLPYDDLHCSFDKISRCVELGIHVLVDDSPVNIARAREEGIVAATIAHPWNEHLLGDDGVVGGADWDELAERLEPVLRRL